MRIGIASDHAGYPLKELVRQHLQAKGYTVVDFGTNSTASCDYPDYAHRLAEAVERNEVACAIAMCGTGNGMALTLNKHQGIRAGLCWTPEIAALVRQHNNANVCVLPARFVTTEVALQMVDAYLGATFEGGRHQLRIDKIPVTRG